MICEALPILEIADRMVSYLAHHAAFLARFLLGRFPRLFAFPPPLRDDDAPGATRAYEQHLDFTIGILAIGQRRDLPQWSAVDRGVTRLGAHSKEIIFLPSDGRGK